VISFTLWRLSGVVVPGMKRCWAILAAAALISAGLMALPAASQPAAAITGSDFDPGYIISDANFYNANAMSQADIQSFLDSKIGTCKSSLCLNVLRVDTTTRAADRTVCSSYAGASQELASAIIFKVQQACGISAKVILVTLQKEQSLVTSNNPTAGALGRAMGYACPDSSGGTCDAVYNGFYNQVYWAAWQFKRFNTPNYFGNYHPGAVAIPYSTGCAGPVVNIINDGTAALYDYTPYQPDPAALANLTGSGDGCSAYGNRNFWVYYNDWFGSPTGNVNPFGVVDAAYGVAGKIHVQGWAMDPDTSASIAYHVYIDGVGTPLIADQQRPDVALAYPGQGPVHGYVADLPVSGPGNHQVCIYGINVGPGTNTLLVPCFNVTTQSGDPFGVIDSATATTTGITVSGWAIDPDSVGTVQVNVAVDGVSQTITADQPRADVALAYPGYGPNHAYTVSVGASPGSHQVCLTFVNVGPGADKAVDCRQITVQGGTFPELNRPPCGVVDSVTVSDSGAVSVAGWAIDPDTAASIRVHVYIDASGVNIPADGPRADVAAAYPGYGPNHEYGTTVQATPGTHELCIYAINAGPGPSNTVLTCRQITVP
jgi:hypothetical protein